MIYYSDNMDTIKEHFVRSSSEDAVLLNVDRCGTIGLDLLIFRLAFSKHEGIIYYIYSRSLKRVPLVIREMIDCILKESECVIHESIL